MGEVWEKVMVCQEVCAQDRLGDVGYQETPTEVSPQSQVQFIMRVPYVAIGVPLAAESA